MKKVQVDIEDRKFQFELRQSGGKLCIKRNGAEHAVDLVRLKNNRYSLLIGGHSYEFGIDNGPDGYTVTTGSRSGRVHVEDFELARMKKAAGIDDGHRLNRVMAPMPGLILHVHHEPGNEVKKGDPLVVMEAMKMENDIKSPMAGKIKTIHVATGQSVEKGQLLVEFE